MTLKTAVSRSISLLGVMLLAACSNPDVEKMRHFERGNEYAAEKRDDFAVIEYASAVQLDPKFGEARLKLAETHERMNNMRSAVPEYIRAADALPGNRDAQIKATTFLLLGGRFEDAKTRATAWLEKNPKDLDAMLLRANAMAALKDPAGALAEIEEALKVDPDKSQTFVNLGALRMQTGDAKEAEAAFRRAIELEPKSANAHLAFANYLWAAERTAEAEQSIKHALVIEPQHLLANRMLGVLYLATRRTSEAEQPLKVVAEVSKTPAARLQLADYYLGAGRLPDATAILTEVAKDPAASAEAETRLASIDYAQRRTDEAHKRLDAVIARLSTYTPALVTKAQWLTIENKLDEALQQAQAAVKGDPESATAHFALASVHQRRREPEDAVKEYTETLRLNPRAVAAQVQLSRLNLATGDRDAALRFAEEAKRAEPASLAVRVALTRSLLSRGDLQRAQVEINEMQRGLPDNPVVHSLAASLHARRGDVAAARKSYERALQLAPGMMEAVAGLAGLDVQAKQLPAAIARVEAEIGRQGAAVTPEILGLAAQLYHVSGQEERSEQALRRAVSIDPRYSAGYAMLASLYMQQRRLDQAKGEFDAMVKRDPAAAGPRTMVGAILEAQGKRDEARRWYEETIAAVKDAPVVANNLAFIYAEQNTNLDMALQLASAAKQGLPESPDVDDTLGWIYYKKDLPALAVRPLEESLKRRPDTPEVLYHLGLVYAKLGDEAKAREALERALKLDPKFTGHEVARQTLATVSSR